MTTVSAEMRLGPAWLLPALVGALVAIVLLGSQLAADPVPGFTFSQGPFTDEGWIVMGGRNAALLGTWATDELHLYLVQLPYNLAVFVVFELFGVGIIQARLVGLACAVLAVALLAAIAARRLGPLPGALAGVGLATSTLYLYYGRLALLEAMVSLFLVTGFALLLAFPGRLRPLVTVAAGASLALAVGAKASALFAAAGIVLGWLAPQVGSSRARIGAALVIGTVTVAGLGWLVLVARPYSEQVAIVFRFWAAQPLPSGLGELWQRIGIYLHTSYGSDGAIRAAAPLLAGGAIGTALAALRWRRLDTERRVLIGAAIGWFVLGAAILLVIPYRPNRYVVPLLPPLALLSAVGLWVAFAWLPRASVARLAATLAAASLLAVPGLLAWSGWMDRATYRLPQIQSELLEAVDGAAMEGGPAPLFGMRVPAPAIIPRPQFGFNDGDLYASHGVRWVFGAPDYRPAWIDRHPEAWASRETVACYDWGEAGTTICLYHLR